MSNDYDPYTAYLSEKLSKQRRKSPTNGHNIFTNTSVSDRGVSYLPSPEEIEERKLQVQATWTERERESRRVFKSPGPVEITQLKDPAFSKKSTPT